MTWLIYVLFMIAGLLVGGAWGAYKNGSTTWAVILGVIALVALAAGGTWMYGELQ